MLSALTQISFETRKHRTYFLLKREKGHYMGNKNKLIDFKVLPIKFKINEGKNKIEVLKGHVLPNRRLNCIRCHYLL